MDLAWHYVDKRVFAPHLRLPPDRDSVAAPRLKRVISADAPGVSRMYLFIALCICERRQERERDRERCVG